MKERDEVLIAALEANNLDLVEWDRRLDEEDCIEIAIRSGCSADESAEEQHRAEMQDLRRVITEHGWEVVTDFGVSFWGWSSWTPEPGDVRCLRIRIRKQ